jgi:hypothetical protein
VLQSRKVEAITAIELCSTTEIAIVGDGINDSPVLTDAFVDIAIASGTDIAIEVGERVLLRSDIHNVVRETKIARNTVDKVKQNLAYAFLHRVVLIPLAALGLLYLAQTSCSKVGLGKGKITCAQEVVAKDSWLDNPLFPRKRNKINLFGFIIYPVNRFLLAMKLLLSCLPSCHCHLVIG